MRSFKTAAVFFVCFATVLSAQGRDAVSNEMFDLSKANRIHIGPGRISVFVFPEAVAEAKVGAPDRLKVVTSATDSKELTLFWIQPGRFETNLIVRTVKRVFVFDIVPSLTRHQDVVRVRGGYSGTLSPLRILESQTLTPNRAKSIATKARKSSGGKIE